MGEMFNCSLCEYKSNKKYNLNRHILGKHRGNKENNTNIDFNNTNIDSNNTNIDSKNTNINFNNTNIDSKNTNINFKNTNIDTVCDKCGKILSSKYYLKEHINKCKGVINSLECYLCHKVFAFSSSKAVHMKKCKINKKDLPMVNSSNLEILSKTQINNNIIINNTYNINLIYYDKEDNKITFDISHFTNEMICKIVTRDETDGFKYFCDKLFENKNNQLIIKKNLRHNYSKIHIGFNYWEKILDLSIYPKIMTDIAETMITYVEKNKGKIRKSKIDYIIYYLDVMASNGYSSKNTNEFKQNYKANINKLKLLFNSFFIKNEY